MNELEYIESVYHKYLKKYQPELVNQFVKAIRNEHENFKPYNSNPKHYIISIYEPLELYYGLLGTTNLGVDLKFRDENIIDNEIINLLKIDKDDPDSKYNPKVIQLKREIEYDFLNKSLIDIQNKLNKVIQLYITQHITEVSYDISSMRNVDSEYLWENLEK